MATSPLSGILTVLSTRRSCVKASAAGTRPVQATGRPTKHDWEGALIEVIRYVHDEGKPEIQADLTRAMQDVVSERLRKRARPSAEIKRALGSS